MPNPQKPILLPVQLSILAKLATGCTLKYSEIVPADNHDLSNYHLKFLMGKGYIEKTFDRYTLTSTGKRLVQHMDVRGNWKEYFKVSVVLYVVRNNQGVDEILMQKRLRHPYYGDMLTVSGKVFPGEKLAAAAARKLKEETGLKADWRFIGVERKMRYGKEGELIEDSLYHDCYGENPRGKLIAKNDFGENFWVSLTKAYEMQKDNITASIYYQKLFNRIKNKDFSFFYWEEEMKFKSY